GRGLRIRRRPLRSDCRERAGPPVHQTGMKKTALFAALLFAAPMIASAQNINDAQIASIVVTANQVDVDAGTLAASTTKNAEVKKFAQLMVTDHTGVNKQAVDLATKLKVT